MTLEHTFDNVMVDQELSKSKAHGVKVNIMKAGVFPPVALERSHAAQLAPGIRQIYSQVEAIRILWTLSERKGSGIETFKSDPWIESQYLKNGYDWPVVHEMLAGGVNLPFLSDAFSARFRSTQAYYYALDHLEGHNPEDYLPFDIQGEITACFKRKAGVYQDHVWLVNPEGQHVHDLGINARTYLELAYKAKGFHLWPLIYLYKSECGQYELMKRFLPKILPHVQLDLSPFGIGPAAAPQPRIAPVLSQPATDLSLEGRLFSDDSSEVVAERRPEPGRQVLAIPPLTEAYVAALARSQDDQGGEAKVQLGTIGLYDAVVRTGIRS